MNPDPRIAFFDGLAEGWDGIHPSKDSMTEGLIKQRKLLNLKQETDLLEVGCGTGKTTGWLASQVAPGRVTAIDFSPQMIIRAVDKQIDADFQCMDICLDPPGVRCFDTILCLHSFPHFRDQAAALRNCSRALTGDGRLIVMHLAGSDHINGFHAGLEGPVQGDLLPVGDEWRPLLEQARLKQVQLIDREDLFFLEATII